MIQLFKRLFLNKHFIKYGIIGISGVVIDFVSYTILIAIGIIPTAASAISVSLGISNNFLWNAFKNFRKKDRLFRRFVTFYAVGCIGMLLSIGIIFLLHDIMELSPIWSKVLSIPPVVIVQFILNKTFSFANFDIEE